MIESQMTKASQYESYDANGAVSGAIAGGALSAILSALYYGKKDKKKQSFAKRFLKSVLWTFAGAAGGGLAGAGIGRALRTHATYEKNLEDAKNKLQSDGIRPRNGRVFLVNYPDNKYKGNEYGIFRKIFPEGPPVQHSMIITTDKDGGNAKAFGAGIISGDSGKKWGEFLIRKGLRDKSQDLVMSGARILSGKIKRGGMYVYDIGDVLKGKSDNDIAKALADFGKMRSFGDKAEVYEGRKDVNVEIPEMFARIANRRVNGPEGRGYEIMPGGYNCGTAARDMFNTVNGKWSHWADMAIGGMPNWNMPSFAKKTTASSHELEGRKSLFEGKPKISNIY